MPAVLRAGSCACAKIRCPCQFPVNAWVLATYDVPNIMSLPPLDAMTLIAISVLLTLVAGIIPSASASRRDPVEALRSE